MGDLGLIPWRKELLPSPDLGISIYISLVFLYIFLYKYSHNILIPISGISIGVLEERGEKKTKPWSLFWITFLQSTVSSCSSIKVTLFFPLLQGHHQSKKNTLLSGQLSQMTTHLKKPFTLLETQKFPMNFSLNTRVVNPKLLIYLQEWKCFMLWDFETY